MGKGGVEQFEENLVTSCMDDPCSEKGVWHWFFFVCYMPLWGTSKKQHFAYIFYVHIAYCERFFFVCSFFSMSVCFVLFFNFFFQVWQKCFVSFSISFQGFSVYFFISFSLNHDKDLYRSFIFFLFLKKEEVFVAWKKFVLDSEHSGGFTFF